MGGGGAGGGLFWRELIIGILRFKLHWDQRQPETPR